MLERPEDFQDISHVVLDEVHERSIDSDFLLIVLRRLMQKRPDLKLILMSATLEAQRFSNYLGGVPVLNIPGRTFPVEMKYLEDAIELSSYRLAENESNTVVDEDTEEMAENSGDAAGGALATLDGYSKQTRETLANFDEYRLDYQLIKKLLIKIATTPEVSHYSKAILIFMPGMAEIRRLNDEILSEPSFQKGWIVHALHSSIASEDQEKAFNVPPEGTRKIVIATNIAETGMLLLLIIRLKMLIDQVLLFRISLPSLTQEKKRLCGRHGLNYSECTHPLTDKGLMNDGNCRDSSSRLYRAPTPSSEEDELDEFRMESASIFSPNIVMTDWYVFPALSKYPS